MSLSYLKISVEDISVQPPLNRRSGRDKVNLDIS